MSFKQPIPKQTSEIYSLLLKRGQLSADEIGKELGIFPHAVYRSIEQLESLGCVNKLEQYPARFVAKPVDESVETFALLQREWFLKAFLNSQSLNTQDGFQPSFIDSRESMFEKMLPDFNLLTTELDLLISGDEAPAEIVLAQKQFIERGGKIRTLVQKKNAQNEPFLKAHKQMGEEVRVIESVHARLMLFDQKIVYVMSYDPQNFIKSMGIRFEYAPLGQLMHGLFMQYWQQGKEL